MWRLLPGTLLVLGLATCASVTPRSSSHGRIVLYAGYISGGVAPLSQSLAIYEDGAVRFDTPGRRPAWARLKIRDRLAFASAIEAARKTIDALPASWVCCDVAQVSLDFNKSPESLPMMEPKHVLGHPDQPDAADPAVRELLHRIDVMGKRNFGWPYQRMTA
jgi:hypothetical protein